MMMNPALLVCRLLSKASSSVFTEVREDGEPCSGLHRLSSDAAGAKEPLAGALRPKVHEAEEKIQLQVSHIRLHFSEVCWFLRNHVLPHPPPPPLSFWISHSIYIFLLFIIRSSFNDFPCAPDRAFNFQRHNRKCHLLPFDRFTHGVQKQANINFTLYEKKGKCSRPQRRFAGFTQAEAVCGEDTCFVKRPSAPLLL